MTELLTAAQMRAIETAAIESGDVTGLELMERAGRGVVEAVFEEWPELGQGVHKAVVLCGPGNNGGDGFVVARLLKERGWDVAVFLYGDAEKLPADAKTNFERWTEFGKTSDVFASIDPDLGRGDFAEALDPDEQPPDIVLDALFGTGLARPIDRQLTQALYPVEKAVAAHGAKIVSVDILSGLCADSGRILASEALNWASLTISFHTAKRGHFLECGPSFCGKVAVKGIGLEGCPAVPPGEVVRLVEAMPFRFGKRSSDHKYSHGHALILTGGAGKSGAARLAARGALRIGAGLVTLGVPPSAQQEVACQITALMLTRVADADGLAEVLQDDRLNALCLGPGLGGDRARELVPVALTRGPGSSPGRAVVLDADALSTFAEAPEVLFEMLHENCVLTPHGGEFARLFPDIAKALGEVPTRGPAYSKVDATREAAKRAGCTVLFKGPDTVIADPDGRCSINAAVYDREAPWLATAGSGDVLAGFITGLLARGFAPMQAAETAAWLHIECARAFGPGLIAEDLPEVLPQVLRNL